MKVLGNCALLFFLGYVLAWAGYSLWQWLH